MLVVCLVYISQFTLALNQSVRVLLALTGNIDCIVNFQFVVVLSGVPHMKPELNIILFAVNLKCRLKKADDRQPLSYNFCEIDQTKQQAAFFVLLQVIETKKFKTKTNG